MFIALTIYLSLIIIHALVRLYLYPFYFDLKPVEKIKKGYLTFNESFTYVNSYIKVIDYSKFPYETRIKYRIDILLKGLYRALFSRLNFESEVKKLNKHISDVSQINPKKFFEYKKRGKIFW